MTAVLNVAEDFNQNSSRLINGTTLSWHQIRPRSNAEQWPDYIPAQIREDYEEACLLFL
jgi:hypothetical protein